jgi:maltooligosyltrehalose trehalohydrolase
VETRSRYAALLALRRSHIIPRLPKTRAIGADAIGPSAVFARWQMGDGAILTIATNLGEEPVALLASQGELLFSSSPSHTPGWLPAATTAVYLEMKS